MDKTTLGIIASLFLLMVFLSQVPVSNLRILPQTIVPFEVTPIITPIGAPKSESSVIAFQSIAFSAGELSSDVLSLQEGPIWLTKFTFGIYNFIWLIIIGIILVMLLPKFEIREIPEKDVPMNLLNWVYLPIIFLSVLWMGGFLTGNISQYSIFYILLFVIGISILAYLRTKKFNVNIAINDGILSNLVDIKFSTQAVFSIFAIFGIFIALNFTKANYAAFSISGSKFTLLNVVPFENFTLMYLPTVLFLLVGNILVLTFFIWCRGEDPSRILSLDKSFIIEKINQMYKPFLVANVVLIILVATLSGYIGAYYHINSYKSVAPYISSKLGITEEQAYNIILQSVGDFWSFGSISVSLTGSIFSIDIVHGIINYQSS